MADQTGYLPTPKGFATAAIHAFQEPEQWDSLALVVPLVASTTFKQFSPAQPKKYEYGRSGNPNRDVLENCLASLENGKYGSCFSSGLGATTALLGLFKSGDHIICGVDVYGGTNRLFKQVATNFGLDISFADENDLEKTITPKTKLIWVESLTNPMMMVNDIPKIVEIARSKHDILVAVDNTFLTPYFQRPLDLGADMVVHSITKYINGHSDVIMGAIVTNNKQLDERIKFLQNAMGIVPAPFDCYQVTRSLKTLALRMQQHMKNSIAVAKYLEQHPKVRKVLHPGLTSHPRHELFKKITSGWSGMMSFYLKGGLKESKAFLENLKIFTLAESLGGYESLAELPSLMTHASVPEEQRKILKIDDSLVRLSVGLEDVEDLIQDMKQALEKV